MTTVLPTLRSHFSHTGMSNEFKYSSYPDMARPMLASSSLSVTIPPPSAMAPSATSSSSLYPQSGSIPDQVNAMLGYMPSHAPDASASCPPEGPSFPVDLEADLASAAAGLSAISGSSSSTNDVGLADSALSFPVLPASLLDEAPEYEFSTHTRMNVFEASIYGGDIPALAFDADGTPILDGTGEYGLWSSAPSMDGQNFGTSTGLEYANDGFGFMAKPESLPRSADLHNSSYKASLDSARPDEMHEATADSNLNSRGPSAFGMSSSNSNLADRTQAAAAVLADLPSSAISADAPPSVLFPGPDAGVPQHSLSLGGEAMSESQAGPSRGPLRRSNDSMSAHSSPHPYGRPPMHQRASYFGSNTLPTTSPTEFNPNLRRLSAGGRAPGRDPVVPSQNVGRARLMSWQSNSMPGQGDDGWQSNVPDTGYPGQNHHGPPGPAGYGMHPSPTSNGMPMHGSGHSGFMPPSRSYAYGMPHANGGFLPHHGMNPHATDMINALGDAMDARIDVDGIAKCPYPNCNKTFAKNRSYNLKAHLRSHSQLKPFACSVCPRAFSRKHDLERHARVHSGDKPYVCEICGKGFPRSDALRRHWRVEKECGDKAAALEAGQSLSSVLGGSAGSDYNQEHSPDQPNHHHQGPGAGMYQQQQSQQQRPPQYGQPQGQQHPQQHPNMHGGQPRWNEPQLRRA